MLYLSKSLISLAFKFDGRICLKRASKQEYKIAKQEKHRCFENFGRLMLDERSQCPRKMAKQGDMPTEGHVEEIKSMGGKKKQQE